MDTRPFRSVLYIPAAKPRALAKAATLPADAIIFDLEDAVAPDAKPGARALLADALADTDYGSRATLVRINDLSTGWGADDIAAIAPARPDAILLPKVTGAADIAALAARLDAQPGTADTAIWAMMETPRGILAAADIARAPRMAGMVMGTNDLAKDMQLHPGADRLALTTALQTTILAAKAEGLVAIDGVYNAFRDTDGLRAECDQGRALGFDGKTLVHPDQIAVANAAFAPSEDEIATARRRIAAHEDALARGDAVAVVDGQIVENLHIVSAKQILAKAAALAP